MIFWEKLNNSSLKKKHKPAVLYYGDSMAVSKDYPELEARRLNREVRYCWLKIRKRWQSCLKEG